MQPYKLDYPKKLIHYRGGSYPFRKITYHPVGEPELVERKLLVSRTLQQLLREDMCSSSEEVRGIAESLYEKVKVEMKDVYFESPGEILMDVINKDQSAITVTHVS